MERDGFRCAYCGRGSRDEVVLRVDHVVPWSKGGLSEESNLVTACEDCNLGKCDADIDPSLAEEMTDDR